MELLQVQLLKNRVAQRRKIAVCPIPGTQQLRKRKSLTVPIPRRSKLLPRAGRERTSAPRALLVRFDEQRFDVVLQLAVAQVAWVIQADDTSAVDEHERRG